MIHLQAGPRAVLCFLLCATLVLVNAASSIAQMTPCVTDYSGGLGTFGGSISVNNVLGFSDADVQEGISYWQACAGYGTGFPAFVTDSTGNHEVDVLYVGGNSGGNLCGQFDPADNRIVIWDSATRPDGSTATCQAATQILAHELGHALGLGNSPCPGYIMSNSLNASVQSPECDFADSNWITPHEAPDPEPPGGCLLSPPSRAEGYSLRLSGLAPEISPEEYPLFSNRTELADGFYYLMEDWAILVHSVDRLGRRLDSWTLNSSTPFYLDGSSDHRLVTTAGNQTAVTLLIQAPDHPHNARHIPLPRVTLRAAAIPYLAAPVSAAVRVDVGESRQVRGAQLLYATGELPQGIDLAQTVASALTLRYESSRQHRVIVFAVVEITDGAVTLQQSRAILPRCCCSPLCV